MSAEYSTPCPIGTVNITDQVTSDGTQVCWNQLGRQLTAPEGSVVTIDAFRYCGGDPICTTRVTAIGGVKTVDTNTTATLDPGESLTGIPEGNPEFITVSAQPTPPSAPEKTNNSLINYNYIPLLLSLMAIVAAARYLGPRLPKKLPPTNLRGSRREQARRDRDASIRLSQAHGPTRPAGALFDKQTPVVTEPLIKPVSQEDPLPPTLATLHKLLSSDFIMDWSHNYRDPLYGYAELYRIRWNELDREEKQMQALGYSDPKGIEDSRRNLLQELAAFIGYQPK